MNTRGWMIEHRDGDIAHAEANAIVNAWNRNFVPRWLLRSAGVSKAIRVASGDEPFEELRRHGVMAVGEAVVTGPGRLDVQALIHVAGINARWRATEFSIRSSISNALDIAKTNGWSVVATPVVGAGTGGFDADRAVEILTDTIEAHEGCGTVQIWHYSPQG
jgi:O-acetyl-ADP-ribose deacetylase